MCFTGLWRATFLPPTSRASRDAEGIFHQAAIPSVPHSIKDPVATNDANVNGTLQVLVVAKECRMK